MIKLNVGCGKRNFGEDWIHVDGAHHSHIQHHDIINLPVEDGTADLIYASHVLEYFDRDEAFDVLSGWHKKLSSDGVLRLAVPDFFQLICRYTEKRNLDEILGPLYGKMAMDDTTIYHKTVYDFYSLRSLLEKVGYINIEKYDWKNTEHSKFDDHSQAYLPHMDKENGMLISLNVQCKKFKIVQS